MTNRRQLCVPSRVTPLPFVSTSRRVRQGWPHGYTNVTHPAHAARRARALAASTPHAPGHSPRRTCARHGAMAHAMALALHSSGPADLPVACGRLEPRAAVHTGVHRRAPGSGGLCTRAGQPRTQVRPPGRKTTNQPTTQVRPPGRKRCCARARNNRDRNHWEINLPSPISETRKVRSCYVARRK